MSEPIVTDEEIHREWDETEHPGTGERFLASHPGSLGQIFARRIISLVRRRLAERLRDVNAGAYNVTPAGAAFMGAVDRCIRIVESDE